MSPREIMVDSFELLLAVVAVGIAIVFGVMVASLIRSIWRDS